MSDSKKSPDQADQIKDDIEDAVIIEEPVGDKEARSESDSADQAEETEQPAGENTPEQDVAADADVSEVEDRSEDQPDTAQNLAQDDAEPAQDPQPDAEGEPETQDPDQSTAQDPGPELETPDPIASAPMPEQVVVRKGGFFPMLLGGVIAAGIGAGGAFYLFPEGLPYKANTDSFQADVQAALAAHSKTDETLQARIDELSAGPDLSAELAPLATGLSDVQAQIGALADRLAALETRTGDLEKRPITEGASQDAVAAYEAELKALQDAMAKQRSEIEAMLTEAEAKETDAELRGALAQLQLAMDTGASFGQHLSALEAAGATVPSELKQSGDGVPTLASLQASFPAAARSALAASRDEQGDGGVLNFLRDQLGVRSLEPREGDSADAVLSRAEAALKAGDLQAVVDGIATLPEAGQAQLAGWMKAATQRISALAAVVALGQQVLSN